MFRFSAWSGLALAAAFAAFVSQPMVAARNVDDLCPEAQDPCVIDGFVSVDDYDELDFGGRGFVLEEGAVLQGGSFVLRAQSLDLRPGAAVIAGPNATVELVAMDTCTLAGSISLDRPEVAGDGGALIVRCGDIVILGSGAGIQVGTLTLESFGDIRIPFDSAIEAEYAEVKPAAGIGGNISLVTDRNVDLGDGTISLGDLILNVPDDSLTVLSPLESEGRGSDGCHVVASPATTAIPWSLLLPTLLWLLTRHRRRHEAGDRT